MRCSACPGARPWRIDRKADYGPFNSVSKGTINLPLIRENWPDVIRLAGSLKLGHLKAAGIMRTLQVRDKPTTLARALSEIGRIAKTIHIYVTWNQSEAAVPSFGGRHGDNLVVGRALAGPGSRAHSTRVVSHPVSPRSRSAHARRLLTGSF